SLGSTVFPTCPGCGLQSCPGPNGPCPGPSGAQPAMESSFAPVLLFCPLICAGSITKTPLGVTVKWTIFLRSRQLASVVKAVLFPPERPARFNVPRLERIEKGEPFCHVKMEPMLQPLITRLTHELELLRR